MASLLIQTELELDIIQCHYLFGRIDLKACSPAPLSICSRQMSSYSIESFYEVILECIAHDKCLLAEPICESWHMEVPVHESLMPNMSIMALDMCLIPDLGTSPAVH